MGRTLLTLRAFLFCGIIGGPLFVVVFITLDQLTEDFEPMRHPVSSLALGNYGTVQEINFLVTGLLMLALAYGARRVLRLESGTRWGPILIAVWGISLIGAGLFATDPVNGFPPGTPPQIEDPSGEGILHSIFAGLGLFSVLVAHFVFARSFQVRNERNWALISAVLGILFTISIMIFAFGLGRTDGLGDVSGLFQRIAIVGGFAWLTAIAISLLIRHSARHYATS